MIDLIVPTVSGREDSLARCISSYEENTHSDALHVIVIRDEPTCGQAWIEGLKRAKGPYVHLSADDLEMTSPVWAAVCIETVDSGRLPCPIVRRPDGSIESCGGDMNAPACLISEEQPDGTEVDFTVSPFMSREQVEEIGMIPAHYLSDTFVSYKGRQLGYPTVVTHGFELIHHHSDVKRIKPNPGDQRIFDQALA